MDGSMRTSPIIVGFSIATIEGDSDPSHVASHSEDPTNHEPSQSTGWLGWLGWAETHPLVTKVFWEQWDHLLTNQLRSCHFLQGLWLISHVNRRAKAPSHCWFRCFTYPLMCQYESIHIPKTSLDNLIQWELTWILLNMELLKFSFFRPHWHKLSSILGIPTSKPRPIGGHWSPRGRSSVGGGSTWPRNFCRGGLRKTSELSEGVNNE